MRFLPISSVTALTLLAAPAVTQTTSANADTYKAVVQHGVVILTPDLEIDVKFLPEGRFVALGGLSKGSWKIVGEKMCSTPDETGMESCSVYPAGKKSGDQFEIPTPDGSRVQLKIK